MLAENGGFIYGVNLPWFGKSDNRANVFGASPFTGKNASYSESEADMALSNISAIGFTSVRTWVFTGWGGTIIDGNNEIIGLTDDFISNLKSYLDLIRKNGLTVNLVIVPHMVQSVDADNQIAAMHTVINESATRSYIDNALIPMLKAISGYQDCIIALDLYCEPEGDAKDTAGIDDENYPGRAERLSDITAFIKAESNAVKSIMPNMKCVVSSAYGQNTDKFATYDDYGIDIIGFDRYNDDSDVTFKSGIISEEIVSEFNDSMWITECNYKNDSVQDWSEEKFSDIIRNFYNNAKLGGYKACYMWHYAASYSVKTSLVEGKKDNLDYPDLSRLRLSAQLLHFDILDYNTDIKKISGNDVPAALINGDNTLLRWLGSRQADYYQIEYKESGVWKLLEKIDSQQGKYLYEISLKKGYELGNYPIRVVSYAGTNRRISNVIE